MGNTIETPQTALKAIRAKCLDCCCGNIAGVRDCELADCPLHRYRLGKNPDSASEPSTKQSTEAIMKFIKDMLRNGAARIEEAFDLARLYFILAHIKLIVWRTGRIQRRTDKTIAASARQGV